MVKNINMLTVFVMLNVIGCIICVSDIGYDKSECWLTMEKAKLVFIGTYSPYNANGWMAKVQEYSWCYDEKNNSYKPISKDNKPTSKDDKPIEYEKLTPIEYGLCYDESKGWYKPTPVEYEMCYDKSKGWYKPTSEDGWCYDESKGWYRPSSIDKDVKDFISRYFISVEAVRAANEKAEAAEKAVRAANEKAEAAEKAGYSCWQKLWLGLLFGKKRILTPLAFCAKHRI